MQKLFDLGLKPQGLFLAFFVYGAHSATLQSGAIADKTGNALQYGDLPRHFKGF